MDSSSSQTGSGIDDAVDLRMTSRGGDVASGRPLDLTLSVLTEADVKSSMSLRCGGVSTPPDTPTSPTAAAAATAATSAFKKTMLKRYSTQQCSFIFIIVFFCFFITHASNTAK